MGADRKTAHLAAVLIAACLAGGCSERTGRSRGTLAPKVELGSTMGSLAEVIGLAEVPVEGFGLVGGLRGTGSAECPPQIRAYLVRYIATQVTEGRIDTDKLISSLDTAVVAVQGVVPAGYWKGQRFDVKVIPLQGTQTTSLQDGWLYTAELNPLGTVGIPARVLATAEGPIYTDKIAASEADSMIGYVPAGATVVGEPGLVLALRRPDYRTASSIRNRLNARFGYDTAKAISSGRIAVSIPAKYRQRKERFVSMLEATYPEQTPELNEARVTTLVGKLAASEDKYASEVALEAIGNASLSKLGVLLNSSNDEVRFRAARCMLYLGSNRGLQALQDIALEASSAHRVAAVEAIAAAARPGDIAAVCRRLLNDSNADMQLAAYEQLLKLDDASVTHRVVANSFHLDQIAQVNRKTVFASRSGQPKIVLFGEPIYLRSNILVQSADGDIVIDSRAGQRYVSLMRRHPTRPVMIGPLKCSPKLSDIIQVLCEEPLQEDKSRGGLGVLYSDMVALLKQMHDARAIGADLRVGPLPEIGLNVKK